MKYHACHSTILQFFLSVHSRSFVQDASLKPGFNGIVHADIEPLWYRYGTVHYPTRCICFLGLRWRLSRDLADFIFDQQKRRSLNPGPFHSPGFS